MAALTVNYRLVRPCHHGQSQVVQSSIYNDAADSTFAPALVLARYPITLARPEKWSHRRIVSAATAALLAVGERGPAGCTVSLEGDICARLSGRRLVVLIN